MTALVVLSATGAVILALLAAWGCGELEPLHRGQPLSPPAWIARPRVNRALWWACYCCLGLTVAASVLELL